MKRLRQPSPKCSVAETCCRRNGVAELSETDCRWLFRAAVGSCWTFQTTLLTLLETDCTETLILIGRTVMLLGHNAPNLFFRTSALVNHRRRIYFPL